MNGGDPAAILDEAVAAARRAGLDCTGWTLQSSDDGYVAWLYAEDEEGQWSLFDEVDTMRTAVAAARWVLDRVSP